MKKRICSLLILMSILQYAHTQVNIEKKELILDTVYRYEVVNPCVYEILDSLSKNVHDCIFDALNRDYFFDLYINEKEDNIEGQVFTYHPHMPLTWYRREKHKDKGFFYYKNQLVLLVFERSNEIQNSIRNMFESMDSMEVVKYQAPKEQLPEVGMGLETTSITCHYDTEVNKLIITKRHLCTGDRYYNYEVKEGDTWEILAEKFVTTVDNIRTINGKYDEREVLPKGHPIMVHYVIVNGVLEVYRKTTRFDRIPMDENWKGKRSKRDLW